MDKEHACGLKVVLPLPLLLIALSCGAVATQGGLVGAWVSTDGQESIEFTKDGTFKATLKYGMSGSLRDVTGTYFVDGAKLSITPAGGHPMTWEFNVSGGEVVFTYVQGGAVKLNGSMAKFRKR